MLKIKSYKNKIFILGIVFVAILGIANFFYNEVKVASGETEELRSDKLSIAIISLSASIPSSLHFKIMP